MTTIHWRVAVLQHQQWLSADGSTTIINDMVEATEETPPPSQSNQNTQSVPDQGIVIRIAMT